MSRGGVGVAVGDRSNNGTFKHSDAVKAQQCHDSSSSERSLLLRGRLHGKQCFTLLTASPLRQARGEAERNQQTPIIQKALSKNLAVMQRSEMKVIWALQGYDMIWQ